MHPSLTIFCPFTRRWAVDRWLENLAAVEHDPKLVNLCFIIDTDEPYIAMALNRFAEERGYRSIQIRMNEEWSPNEVRLSIRRQRVADIHNQSKELIRRTDGELIIGLEDDTVFDRLKSFDQLIDPILIDDSVGFVEGVQMGRWSVNMIGAWLADDPVNTQQIETLLPPNDIFWGEQPISGGGFYGYATQRELYLNHDYYWSSGQPWGPDVNYGLWLNSLHYKCLIDWSVVFGHNDHNIIGYPDPPPDNQPLAKVIYTKDRETGKWERRDHEQGRY